MASSRQDIDELEVAPDRKAIVTPSESQHVVSLRAVPAGGKGDFERVVAGSEEEHPRGEIGGSTWASTAGEGRDRRESRP